MRTIEKIEPEMIFNLAAQSSVSTLFKKPIITSEINGIGALKILEAVKIINKKIKLYQASSLEMFGKAVSKPQDEKNPFFLESHMECQNYLLTGLILIIEKPIKCLFLQVFTTKILEIDLIW